MKLHFSSFPRCILVYFQLGKIEIQYHIDNINPAINFVIPAVAKRRAGIQGKLRYYWIPAFAGMTGW